MKRILTTCGYCGCGCNYYFNVENDEIVGVSPQNSHPVSQGKLCVKGWQGYSFVNSKDRLKTPLIRDENGQFEEASWDLALKKIHDDLSVIIEKHGPDSVGILASARCTNEENYLITKFARSVLKTPNIDHCARLCHSPTVAGLAAAFGSGAMTNTIEELSGADVIFVIGSNTTEQHPLVAMKIIEAVKNGCKLIVADPRKIPLTYHSHIYAPIAPGSNLAFINGILNVIVEENLINESFIKERTEGFGSFKESVRKYSSEKASEISGVPAEKIVEIARLFAGAKNASIVYAMGITQHISGTKNVAALANLALVTGQIGRESTGVNPLRGQGNVQGGCDMGALPDTFPGYQKLEDPGVREKFETVWGKDFAANNGMSLGEMIHGAKNGKIKALYIIGENPMITDPNLKHVKEALENVELLIVQDIFMTETGEFADIILPAASFIEKDGTFTNTERRVQRVRKALEPVGDSKADWEILRDIMQTFDTKIKYDSPLDVMEEIRELVPLYGGISYERLEDGGLQWPCPSLDHSGTKFLHENKFTRGLGKFTVNEYEETLQVANADYPFILTTGRIQHHYHSGTMTRRAWALEREHPEGFVEINPRDAEKLGMDSRSKVKISSANGEIICDVLITENISEGVLFVPFHFKEIAVNNLIGDSEDPVVQIPEYKVCAVKVEVMK